MPQHQPAPNLQPAPPPPPPAQVNLIVHHPPPAVAWAYDDKHEVGQLLVIFHAPPTSTTPTTTTSIPTTPIVATLTSPLYNNPVILPVISSPLNIPFSPAPAPLLATPSIIDTTSPPLHHNLALRSGWMFHRMYPNVSVSMPGQPTQPSNNQQQQQDIEEIDPVTSRAFRILADHVCEVQSADVLVEFLTEPVTSEAHPYPHRLRPVRGRRTRIKYVIGLTGLAEAFRHSWYQSKKFEMADRRDWGGGGDDPEDSTQRMIERIWESLTDIRARMDQLAPVPPVAVPPRDGETVPIAPVPPGVEVPFVAPVRCRFGPEMK
ncbi:hypothetical protein Taro_041636 [Colocasia esculenta]|uniref:Uncharacterized protein n=1 Tax=Colocasia esculenta TaxID=4460 RepID=A0A843WQG7_COLES|nr:hypothetical protein [Colocasia esculenta]